MKQLLKNWLSPSLVASIIFLATHVFYWDGVDLLTPFIWPLLALNIDVGFAVVLVSALIVAVLNRTEAPLKRFKFVLLDVIVALTVALAPIDALMLRANFYINYPSRMHIVELASQGKLARPYSYNKDVCLLPTGFGYLSKGGGDVIVTGTSDSSGRISPSTIHVLFYTFRGILSRHAGYEYCGDGGLPMDASETKQVLWLRDKWYWVTF